MTRNYLQSASPVKKVSVSYDKIKQKLFAFSLFAILVGSMFSVLPGTIPGVIPEAEAFSNGKIAFHSNRDGNNEIYTMNSDGTGQTRITTNLASDARPSWSPGSTKIAFDSNRDGNIEIYTMNADGTGVTRLTTNNGTEDAVPNWSPDGTKIAFWSDRDGNAEIYTMNADGSGPTNLSNNNASDVEPKWSPDGTKIVFTSNRDGNNEVYTMNSDGTGQTRLTTDLAHDYQPYWSPDGTKIAFASIRDGNQEVYVMNSDGTGQTRLTISAGKDEWPSFSPDGTKIAFYSERDGNGEIYKMNSDGTGVTRLTNNGAADASPSWGPLLGTNGKIAFRSDRDGGNPEIYVMNSDGSGPTRLTNNTVQDIEPSWSPDGTKIAFRSDRDGNAEIYKMNADGTGQTNISNNPAADLRPRWSPDGTKIAFYTSRDSNFEIYTMNADGSGQTRLTNNTAYDQEPSWSPGSTKIAFTSNRDGNNEIYTMNSDGTGQTRLTNNTESDSAPSWSPDGTKIAFESNRNGNPEIYVMNSDGTGQTRITNNTVHDERPSWSPDGTKIAFMSNRDGNLEIYTMNADGSGQTRLTNNSTSDDEPNWGTSPNTFNAVPLANDDSYTTTVNTPLNNLNVLANDTDADLDTLTISAVSSTLNNGSAVINGTSTGINFTPAAGFRGVDRFNYTISDGNGGFDNATVTMVILGTNGKIAFESRRDGNAEIYTMNSDGTAQTRLTNNAAFDDIPSWSPNGTKIAFRSDRDGNNEIYVMNADGTGQTNISNNAAGDGGHSWSPDGTKIAFQSNRDGNLEIYAMNSDGSGQTRLTNNTASERVPSWSPDGTKIAFQSGRDGNGEIYVMNSDGTGQTNLSNNAADDDRPSWSPDGTKIAFESFRDGTEEIYVMNSDGTGQTRLTNNAVNDFGPSWSPDGTKIAFESTDPDGGDLEIYSMNSDGTGQTRLTNNTAHDDQPSWGTSPNTFNTAPVANDDTFTTQFETSANNLNVLANDTDADLDTLTISAVTSPINGGTAVINGTSNGIDFTPAAEFRGVDRFNYTASDGQGGSDTATVTIAILGTNGKIAFDSSRDGNFEIYSMNSDGTAQIRLTNNTASDVTPSWSPNGTKIVFQSTRDGDNEIYVMNSDGTGLTKLTNNTLADDSDPSWSPDGTKITFHSTRDGNFEIYKMNADGTAQTRLTNNTASDVQPRWSPDGTKIVFVSIRDGNSEIYVMNADGTGQTNISNNAADDEHPSWSAYGTKIAFRSDRDANRELYVMNADGTGQTRLTNAAGDDQFPSWSPDATKIAFSSARDGNNEIYTMNADGTGQTRVTNNAVQDLRPSWGTSPDSGAGGAGAPPIANAGADQTRNEQTVVTLTGTDSRDPDGIGITSYSWAQVNEIPQDDRARLLFENNVLDGTGGNDGTVTGTETYVDGKPGLGKAFSFNGASYVKLATETDFDFERTDPFSVSLWVKPTTSTATQVLVDKASGTTSIGWNVELYAGKPFVSISNTAATKEIRLSAAPTINDGQWHHVVVTYDGSGVAAGVKVYSDNVLRTNSVQYNTLGANSILNNLQVAIGATNSGGSKLGSGSQMDGIRIYPRALSSSEVQGLFNEEVVSLSDPAASQPTFTSPVVANGQTKTNTFRLTVTDSASNTSIDDVSITTNPVNINPTATADSFTVTEDSGSTTFAVKSNDSDPDGDTITITTPVNTAGTQGTATTDGSVVTFTPAANFNGVTSFAYTISDNNGGAATATVPVTVTAANDAPLAVNDQATTGIAPIDISVLLNDVDPDGNTLTITGVNTAGTQGGVTFTSTTVTYTPPNTSFTGSTTFTYTVTDNHPTSPLTATATVTVSVNEVTVSLDSEQYGVNEAGQITVADAAASSVTVNVISQNGGEPAGIDISLEPTPGHPGIFRSPAQVSFSDQVAQSNLATSTLKVALVSGADTVTVTYTAGPNTRTDTATINPVPQVIVGNVVDTHLRLACTIGDADQDFLCDEWEQGADGLIITRNIDDNADGITDRTVSFVYPCDPSCPNPGIKDAYYELDWLLGHEPDQTAVDQVVAAFADKNINLHILKDEDIGVHYDHTPFPGTDADPGFDQIKAEFFGTQAERSLADAANVLELKRNAFRYGLFAHSLAVGSRTSGMAESPGNDLEVTLGTWAGGVGSVDQQAGTLMHEIGHNLDLGHGGNDDINCKPPYVSVMSYSNQFSNFNPSRVLSYSSGLLGSLDERALDESRGIGSAATAGLRVVYGTPSGVQTAPADGSAINWNGDGTTPNAGTVEADINNLGIAGCDTSLIEPDLHDYDDWLNLNMDITGPATFYTGIGSTVDEQEFDVQGLVNILNDLNAQIQALPDGAFVDSDGATYRSALDSSIQQAIGHIQAYGITGLESDLSNAISSVEGIAQTIDGVVIDPSAHATLSSIVTKLLESLRIESQVAHTEHDGPIASDDNPAAILEDSGAHTFDVLFNDDHFLGDSFLIVEATHGTKGMVSITNGGADLTYTLSPNENGADSFSYTIQDSQGKRDTATVFVTISPLNDDPTANDDAIIIIDDSIPVVIPVLGNDFDLDGDTLDIVSVSQGAKGTVTNNGGDVTYERTAGQTGVDSFDYTISDSNGGSATATVNIVVDSDADGIANEVDPNDDDRFTDVPIGGTTFGQISSRGDQTLLITDITPNPSGGMMIQAQASGAVTDATFSVCSDAAVISLGAGSAVDLKCSSVSAKTTAGTEDIQFKKEGRTRASAALAAGNGLSYSPDTLTITAFSDNVGPVTVIIDGEEIVLAPGQAVVINDPPVPVDDNYSTYENTVLVVSDPAQGILANDNDAPSDKPNLTAILVDGVTHGGLTLNSDGTFTYQPSANFFGTDSFTYRASDGKDSSAQAATVTIEVKFNNPPTSNNDAYSVNQDTTLSVAAPGVLANDDDVEQSTLSAILVTGPSHGDVDLRSDGSFDYVPQIGYHGTDTFTYHANDGSKNGNDATVTITINAVAPTFITTWGSFGTGDGQFKTPYGNDADSAGNVYVADTGNNRIQKFDSAGTFLLKWGTMGTQNGKFKTPYGIGVDSADNVYVAESGNSRIQKFDSAGTFLLKWGSSGNSNGKFNTPTGIAIDSAGNVYVADTGNNRIQKFSSAGTFIVKWGTSGTGDGKFNTPTGIAIDSAGNVYVADTGNNRIQKFDSAGTFLLKWGSSGNSNGKFNTPTGIAIDSAGNVYVADTGNNRIQKFSSAGTFIVKWGTFGTGDGQFNTPTGISIDSAGNVYVSDTNNNRIQKFR